MRNQCSKSHPLANLDSDRATRRRFASEYKLRILQEYDALKDPHDRGALLRREGLYSSHIAQWRVHRRNGKPRKRGRPPKAQNHASSSGYVRSTPNSSVSSTKPTRSSRSREKSPRSCTSSPTRARRRRASNDATTGKFREHYREGLLILLHPRR